MLSTLLLVASLQFGGFPEVPVGPVSPPVAQEDEEQPAPPPPPAEPPADDLDADEAAAARDRAARERAIRDQELEEEDWAKEKKRNAAPAVEFRALATTTLPMDVGNFRSSGDALVGLRGELDIGHFSALFSWDRGAAEVFNWRNTFRPTSYWNGLIGPSVWATRHNRIRLLCGLSAISSNRTTATIIDDSTGASSSAR